MLADTGTSTGQCRLDGLVSGTLCASVTSPLNNGSEQSLTFSRIVYLDGTSDEITFVFYQNSGVSRDVIQGTNGKDTWFSINLISQ
jgi:hypothetical protein